MAFKSFVSFDWINLFFKGDILNIIVFFITFFFLCKICFPHGIAILLMFLSLRDNINKFLIESLENGSCDLFLLTEGCLLRFFINKAVSFIISYGATIFILTVGLHFTIYTISMHYLLILFFYISLFLLFFLTLAFCSILIYKYKNSYMLMNLIYPPFIIPTALLANLFLDCKIEFQVIMLINTISIISFSYLLKIIIKNMMLE